MKTTSSWFDVFALLVISLMSVAAGVATDTGRAESPRPAASGQQ
jgi:hypothetical protein